MDIQELYVESLRAIGTDFTQHDVRFVEDDEIGEAKRILGLMNVDHAFKLEIIER